MAEHSHSCAGCRYEDNVYMACIGCGGRRYTPPEESEAEKAARRAGKAEGLREAAKLVDFSEERTGLESCCQRATRKYRNGAAAVLLARAEEVERNG